MTDEQIEQLLQKARRQIWFRTFTPTSIGWGLALVSTSALLVADMAALATLFGVLQLFPAAKVSQQGVLQWRKFKRVPVGRLWRELTHNPKLFVPSSAEVSQFATSLQAIYENNPQGEILPITQATRLLLIYNLQQRRLQTLLERGATLRSVREQLLEKSARLHQLGDTNSAMLVDANEMEQDIAALEQLSVEIQASCHRLEGIALSAQRAAQVKQLHREIGELRSSVSSEKSSSAQLSAPEVTDIERQISREIETYLQLERETDTHLHDL